MRPGDFSPGNRVEGEQALKLMRAGFNEAGGFLPRKPACEVAMSCIAECSLQ